MKRIVILGAGAVGGYIGARLHQSGFPVTLVARGEHALAIENNGLTVHHPEGSSCLVIPCRNGLDHVSWRAGDVVICAVKSQHAEQALDELLRHAGSTIPVVCASNGINNERLATRRFEQVVSMMVWLPATHLDPGVISIHARGCPGVLDLGGEKGERAAQVTAELSTLLTNAGFSSKVRRDIKRWKHAKWISNLGNTAQALITDDWLRVAEIACAEGEAVFEEAGIDRVSTEQLLERCKIVEQVAIAGQQRGGGSTWQSFKRGKSLETPFIEGAMVRLATRTGVPAPVISLLVELAQDHFTLSAAEFLELLQSREDDDASDEK